MRDFVVLAAVLGLVWYLAGKRKQGSIPAVDLNPLSPWFGTGADSFLKPVTDENVLESNPGALFAVDSLFAVDGDPSSPWSTNGGAGPFLQNVDGTNVLEFHPELAPRPLQFNGFTQ